MDTPPALGKGAHNVVELAKSGQLLKHIQFIGQHCFPASGLACRFGNIGKENILKRRT